MKVPEKIRLLGKNVDFIFLALLGGLFLLDLPFFLDYAIPLHDTFSFSQFFYFFYNELLQNGALAWWMPFGMYGFPSNFWFMAQPPTYYFMQILGWLLGLENGLALFKATIFIEQSILLTGTYLLSRKLFKHKMTAAFVCLTVMGSTAMIAQVTWNFYIFYMLPLLIYLLIRFFESFKLQYLFLAGIVTVFSSLPGGAPYMSVIIAMETAIISIVLFAANIKRIPGSLTYSRNDVLLSLLSLSLLGLISVSYYSFIQEGMAHAKLLLSGRDPETGVVSLHTFLTYGGSTGLGKFRDMISPNLRLQGFLSNITAMDTTLFMGLIFLFFLGLSLRSFRKPAWLALAAAAIFLGVFSLGEKGVLARLLYEYFPPIRYYRHIGYVVTSFKVLLPLMAGFGLERLLDRIGREASVSDAGKSVLRHELFIVALLLAGSYSFAKLIPLVSTFSFTSAAAIYLALATALLIVLFLLRRKLKPRAHFSLFLTACLCFELISYQASLNLFFHRNSNRMRPYFENAYIANDYGFQQERTKTPPSKRADKTFLLSLGTTIYTSAYNFMQWDPCVPAYRLEMINSGVSALFSARGGSVYHNILRLPDDPYLMRSIGCGSSKLKLINNITFAENEDEAFNILQKVSPNSEMYVLAGFSEADRSAWHKDGAEPAGNIKVTDYTANSLKLEASLTRDAWLYYADAWHPSWKAYVNGKPTTIAKANLGFKAIRLEAGKSDVSFVFEGISRLYGTIIFVLGASFAGALLILVLLTVFRRGPVKSKNQRLR